MGGKIEAFESLSGERALADSLLSPIHRFMRFEAAGGVVVVAAAAAALIWANSPWGASYAQLWGGTNLRIGVGAWGLDKPLILWINDLLMAVFFLLVGLEVKREILVGELSSPRKAALPLAAALGGMAVPALLYAALNWGTPGISGWGVPMATDIAFALGVLALVGRRVPVSAKVFLTTLAVADDLGALLVIALFYTDTVQVWALAVAGGLLVGLAVAGRAGVRSLVVFLIVGLAVWYFVLKSGVHATLAGVALAAVIPIRARAEAGAMGDYLSRAASVFAEAGGARELNPRQQGVVLGVEEACRRVESPLRRLEHALLPWVAFLVVPVFALANAGVPAPLGELGVVMTDRAALGVFIGLVAGKVIGVTGFSWLAVRLGFAALPTGLTWRHVFGLSWLAAIGFTMALFIASLAFADAAALDRVKLAILCASAVSGVVGAVILATAPRASADARSGAVTSPSAHG